MNNLETTRLIIRPFTMDDLEAVHQLLDLDLHWSGDGISIEQRWEKLQLQVSLAQWTTTDCLYGDRAIVLKESEQLTGICGFRPWLCSPQERCLYQLPESPEPSFHSLELGVGYALSSQHRGQGYATEAVKALLEYGFTRLRVGRIVALTDRGNTSSVNVMRRVGMQIGVNPDPEALYPWVFGIIENPAHRCAGDEIRTANIIPRSNT